MEWDELCTHVSRFAATTAGKKDCRRLKKGRSCEEALILQAETSAVGVLIAQLKVELDFGSLSTEAVMRALNRCSRGGMLAGLQLKALATLLSVAQVVDSLIL